MICFPAIDATYSLDPADCCTKGHKVGTSILHKDTTCVPSSFDLKGFKGFLRTICAGMFKGCCSANVAAIYCRKGVELAR